MLVIAPDGRTTSGDQYYEALRARIKQRWQWLGGTVTLGEFEVIEPEDEASARDEAPVSQEP
jgi:hypothetical protein